MATRMDTLELACLDWNCAWYGAGSRGWYYREREREGGERVAMRSEGELERGRRAPMWMSPKNFA